MRSVWSRLGLGSPTVVSPSACSPASRTAVFTCALATGSSYVIPCSRPPSIVSGGRSSVVRTVAPIARSGAATRSTGRLRSDSSPVSTVRKGRPASAPASMRIVEPEFSASSTACRRAASRRGRP